MPDKVHEGPALCGVEGDSHGVSDAAGKNPEEAVPSRVLDERSNPKDAQPAHAQVDQVR